MSVSRFVMRMGTLSSHLWTWRIIPVYRCQRLGVISFVPVGMGIIGVVGATCFIMRRGRGRTGVNCTGEV